MIRELNVVEVAQVSGGMEEVKVVAKKLTDDWVTSIDPSTFGGERLRNFFAQEFEAEIMKALDRAKGQDLADVCAGLLLVAQNVSGKNKVKVTPDMTGQFSQSCSDIVAKGAIWGNKQRAYMKAIGIL